MGDRNHELIISLFTSIAKRVWKLYTTEKSRFCYISRSTQKLYCMDFSRVNQNPPQHVPIMPHTTEKKNFDDFVTYPKALSNCIAWTLAWVNQKGYVTYSSNVTHDEKNNINSPGECQFWKKREQWITLRTIT